MGKKRRRGLLAAGSAAALFALLLAAFAYARSAGRLDRSFGDRGISVVSAARDRTESLDIGRKGRIVLAGYSTVARLLPNGRLDQSFGDGGIVKLQISGDQLAPWSVAIGRRGGVFLAGADCPTQDNCEFAVKHLTREGKLDLSFGNDGTARIAFPRDHAEALSIEIARGGDLIVGGFGCRPGLCGVALARLNPDGSLKRSFGDHGKVVTPFGGCAPDFGGMALDSRGRIAVGGSCDAHRVVSVVRFHPNGKLDRSFGHRGHTTKHVFIGKAMALAIDSRNRIDLAGSRANAYGVVRFKSNGRFDSAFGKHGTAKATFPVNRHVAVHAMAIDSRGRIVVAGHATGMGFARFKRGGSVDRRFGHRGVTMLGQGEGLHFASSVAIDRRDRIVAGARHRVPHSGGAEDLAAVRLLG